MLHCRCWWGKLTSVTLSLEPQHSLSLTLVSYVDDRSSPLVRTCTTSLPTTTGQYFYHFSYYYCCCYYWIVQLLPILAPWSSFMGVLGVSILTPMLLSTQPCNQLIPPIAQYQLLLKSHTRVQERGGALPYLGIWDASQSVPPLIWSLCPNQGNQFRCRQQLSQFRE